MPRRPTYATSTVVAPGSWRSTVTFQAHARGMLKIGSCAVTTNGKSRRAAVERHAVADDESTRAIDQLRLARIVEPRIERREVAVAAVPLRPERVPHADFDRDLAARLPAVLGVRIERGGDPRRRGFRA